MKHTLHPDSECVVTEPESENEREVIFRFVTSRPNFQSGADIVIQLAAANHLSRLEQGDSA